MNAPNKSTPAQPGWVALAVVTQPHGVSGRVKVKSFTDPEDAIKKHSSLQDPAGREVKFRVTGTAQGQYIIEVEGLTKREDAELWRGKQLGMPRAALPELKNDAQYYVVDLVGLCVETEDGRAFGTVHALHNFGAGDLLELKRPNGDLEMFSFTHVNFPSVDVKARKIIIAPPEKLGSREEENAGE